MNPASIFIALCKVVWWAYCTTLRCIWGSFLFLGAVRKWRDKDKPTHGNAAFALVKELRKRGYLKPKGFLMCVIKRGRFRRPVHVYSRDERSILIMAPPGSGKSQQLIADLRMVLKRPAAKLPFLIVGDAGDELFTKLGPSFQAAGYSIAKIDAVQPDEWTKYDILSGLTPRKKYLFNTQVKGICEGMVPDEPHSKHPHFVEFARLLLKCIITVDVQHEGNRRTIGEMVDLLLDEDARDAMLKRAALYDDVHIRKTLQVMQKMQDNNEGVSMMSTALRKLEPWGDPAVREVTTFGNDLAGNYRRGWSFTQMLSGDKPVVLFIRTGYQDIGGALARIAYSNAVNEVSAMWDETSKPLSRELLLYLDEAGLAGHVSAFVKAFSRLRKVGVRLRMCFVSMDEFKKCYPDDHKTFLNGCDILVPAGGNDLDMYAYAEKLAGEFTVQSRSENESDHGQSKGRSEQARKLVKQDEFRREERDTVFAFMDNQVVRGSPPWEKVRKRWTGQESITYL